MRPTAPQPFGLAPLSSAEPSNPPADPVAWLCVASRLHSRCEVMARTWFEARRRATEMLGCGPEDLKVEEVR